MIDFRCLEIGIDFNQLNMEILKDLLFRLIQLASDVNDHTTMITLVKSQSDQESNSKKDSHKKTIKWSRTYF